MLLTPCLGFAAWSGTGKTTLLTALIPRLRQAGLRLGLLKHSHHALEIDHPGKDSQRLRAAGATQLVIASNRRLVHFEHGARDFTAAMARFDRADLDLILVEGHKHAALPKIELHRAALGHALLATHDAHVIAIASDDPQLSSTLPVLPLDDADALAAFVLQRWRAGALAAHSPGS
ncbi:molybdopterin-guanine dinucleotide biosynthesis protein B [Plasticicumulans acidivorans]|uniref:Molybdopterin guanine dinucleotide biosynthesis accessory protein MobB n=1 Tax=Plasticicumulans acidivorans TaxID=886464 RepID=A0A317MUJ5_9GAMM|nr:molybdopterin-guanine dinucleotide biosynthesis protein B [Plasticicumulans acidivorans]PWV61643.1 molybdopterin guanine dinucleotide biosynthesis accessory protein MobB [Plasticicumulans acidivorans]